MSEFKSNFRVTTEYILELLNVSDGNFYSLFVSGSDGAAKLEIADSPDVDSEELEWNYILFQLPEPPVGSNSNYRKKDDQTLQIYNITTAKWHTLFIGGTKNNPQLSIAQEGEV